MSYAAAVQARANAPQPISSNSEFDYQVQELADEYSTLGQNSEYTFDTEPTGESGVQDYVNRRLGINESEYDEPNDPIEPSVFAAGVDQGHHLFYQGGKAFAQYLGLEDAEEWFQEGADVNLADATVPLEGYKDMIIYGAGTVGATVPAMLAGLVAAPLVGLGGSTGLALGATLAGIGMTNGDVQTKSEELARGKGEDYTATGGALLTGTALGAMDLIAINKLKTIMSPLSEVIKQTARDTATNTATSLAGSAVRVAKGSVQVGGAEALQDAAASVTANVVTDTEIDESRVNAIANAAVDEFIVGAVLGVPLSGMSVATENIGIENAEQNRKLREEIENMTDEEKMSAVTRDEEGNMVVNQAALERLIPTEGAVKNPGFFKQGFHMLTGNSTDLLKAKYTSNPWVQALGQQFNINQRERAPGRYTITEEGQSKQAVLFKTADTYLTATEEQQRVAWENKAKGLAPENEIESSLYSLLNEVIPDMYRTASRKADGSLGGMFERADYLPSNLAVDMELVVNDPAIEAKAKEDLLKRYDEGSKEYKQGLKALKDRTAEYKQQGNNLSYSPQTSLKIETYLTEAIEEGASPKKIKKYLRKMQQVRESERKRSPLDTQRQLQNFSQEFLNQYYSKNKTPKDIINQHIKQVAEHAALIDRFGENFELFDEMVGNAVAEGNISGQSIEPADIKKMYDVLRTQQRIHLSPVGEKMRNFQNKVRAATNIRLLGLSSLVSIPESLVIFMNTGGSASLKGLLQTMNITNRTALASKDLGMSADLAMNHAANRVNEESYDIPGWEQTFFKYFTGLPQLQHFLTTWATRSQDIYIKRMVDDLDNGKLNPAESDMFFLKLHEAGIDLQGFQQWKQGEYALDDPYFTDVYAPALVGLVRDTIVDPNPIDKPLWMNDERFLLVAQLKGFMTTFTNRVMRGNWLKTRALAGNQNLNLIRQLAIPTAMYLSAQVGVQAVREFANSGDTEKFDDKPWGDRIMRAFSYLGAFGFFSDFASSFKYRRSFITSQIPALGLVTSATEGAVQVMSGQNPDEAMGKLVSGIVPNMPGGSWLKSNTEEIITDLSKEAGL